MYFPKGVYVVKLHLLLQQYTLLTDKYSGPGLTAG
jgi:hypothetical protein